MVDLPKLDFVGFTSVLAGIVFLLTGLLMIINTLVSAHDPVNPSVMAVIGLVIAAAGALLLLAKDD